MIDLSTEETIPIGAIVASIPHELWPSIDLNGFVTDQGCDRAISAIDWSRTAPTHTRRLPSTSGESLVDDDLFDYRLSGSQNTMPKSAPFAAMG